MKNFSTLIFAMTILSSCRKDDTQVIFSLPVQTQSGENTFGLLLNNSVWTNYGQVCFPFAGGCRENLKGVFYKNDGDILINADRVIYKDGSRSISESFEINLKTKFNGARTYSTLTNDTISIAYYFKSNSPIDTMYILPQVNPTFSIRITKLDTINNILSGEFSGTIFKRIDYSNYTTSLTDSINIKDGRFDIKLK